MITASLQPDKSKLYCATGSSSADHTEKAVFPQLSNFYLSALPAIFYLWISKKATLRNSGVVAQGMNGRLQITLRSSLLDAYGSMKLMFSRPCWKQLQPAPELRQQHSPPPLQDHPGSLIASRESLPSSPLCRCADILPLLLSCLQSGACPQTVWPSLWISWHLLQQNYFLWAGPLTVRARHLSNLECMTQASHPGYAGILVKSDIPFFIASFSD